MFNIFIEIIKNILIAVPGLKKLAQSRHKTGLNADDQRVSDVSEKYFSNYDVSGKDILELGPGHTYQVMQQAKLSGASTVVMCDVEKYLSAAICRENEIKYEIFDGIHLPFPDQSFDMICSHTVLEHVRYPMELVGEMARVIRPGGRITHFVDLRDHLTLGCDDENIFRCMQFHPTLWKWMAWYRSTYVNRLRYGEWLKVFAQFGFKEIATEKDLSSAVKDALKNGGVAYLSAMSLEDACTKTFWYIGEKDN